MKWIIILAVIGLVIWLLKRNQGGQSRALTRRSAEHDHDHHGRGSDGDGGNGGSGGNGGGE